MKISTLKKYLGVHVDQTHIPLESYLKKYNFTQQGDIIYTIE
jgi:hypothetical protein